MMKRVVFIFGYCFFSFAAIAQELPPATQQQLENAAEALDDEAQKDDSFLQQLDYYTKHPINLNEARAEDLQPLRFLNDLQIQSIVRYRNLLGKFINIYELQAVPSLDLVSIKKILPYVYVGPAVSTIESLGSRFKDGDQYILFRLSRVFEKQKGYNTSLATHYSGDQNHLLLRYRYQYKDLLQFGLVADKDPGEQFFGGAQNKGFDFYSVHFFARRLGKIKALAVGDYVVNLGQGLTEWQSLAFGKSPEVTAMKRQSPVLMPYRSAGEFYFNRGAGITIQNKKTEVTAFLSSKKFSGNYVSDTVDRFSSLQTSGYYRTPSEISDRYNLSDVSFGGNVTYQTSSFKIGLNTVTHNFSLPFQKKADPYNYFAFSGKTMINSSIDYSYTYKNVHLFGELAADKDFHKAFVNGVLISADPKVDLSFFYRNISKEYQSFFGNAFTENTLPTNEKGFYTGVVVRPVLRWQLSAYADFYQFPFFKFRVNAPSKGFDYLVQLSFQPDKKTEIYVRYRNENKPVDESNVSPVINFPVDKVRQNLRINFTSQASSTITIKNRVEILWYDREGKNGEEGFLAYIEGSYKPSIKLSANLRLQYFETGGYNSRIYAYESDVLYSISIPAFYDKGFRYYVNVNYDLSKRLSFWIRLAQTIYNDKTVIGSGLDEIQGKRKTEGKLQVVWHFG